MVSPRPETENSGHKETDSRRGDLPLQSPPSPHSRESSQSRKVSTEKSGDFPERSERRSDVETHASTATWTTEIMPGGGDVQQHGTAGAVSKECSTIEEEQANHYKDELKEETGGNPEGLASRPSSRYGTEAATRAKASPHTDKSGCTWGVGTTAEEIASSRMDDPDSAQQKVSVAEHSSTECTEDREIKSGSLMANVKAVDAASSRASDPSYKPAATAESRAKERESSEHGHCSIWSQYISAQPLEVAQEGVRKIALEEQPPPLVEEATSSAELPDDSPEPAAKAEPSVPRKLSPPSATSAEQKKPPVSLQRLGKRRLSSDSESTGEISGRPPASRRRAEETRGAGEPQDTSDESIPFPSVQTKYFFRPIEVAPVSAGSEMKVIRPVPLRPPVAAQTASKFVSGATNVSELAELAVGKLTDSASDRDTVPMGDDCSSDTDRTSPCSTLSYSDETEQMSSSSAYESGSSKTTDDERGGANESSGSESDITVGALEKFYGVQNMLSCIYSETSSDSSETSVNGRGGTVDGSGDTTSAVDLESSNTADDKERSTAESDAARFGAGRASRDSFSEGYVGRTESSGGSPTQGAGDSKTTISLSAEDAEGFGALRDVEASHNHSEVEAGNSSAN
ncbi:hypothetical protein HPB50_027932 [Hyalomma asiaticum]|nr:hypothetical protein HPB50_027932 [Hyalomma asiaticum]